MSITKEIARTIRAFRGFVFNIPKGKGDRQAWKFVLALWGSIALFWTCFATVSILISVVHAF